MQKADVAIPGLKNCLSSAYICPDNSVVDKNGVTFLLWISQCSSYNAK